MMSLKMARARRRGGGGAVCKLIKIGGVVEVEVGAVAVGGYGTCTRDSTNVVCMPRVEGGTGFEMRWRVLNYDIWWRSNE